MPKQFKPQPFQQFEIVEDGRLDCTIRLNPGSIMYSPAAEPNAWYTLPLKQFSDFARAQGRKEAKQGAAAAKPAAPKPAPKPAQKAPFSDW